MILAINLVITFLPTLLGGSLQISWQGHVGGLLAGFLVGFILVKTKRLNQRGMQAALLSLTAVALIGLLVAAPALLG